jgi:3-hydroxybutyryl-CoA dehydrogenase
MQGFEQVAVLGAGVIGASWTSLFLAADLKVDVYDPSSNVERSVRNYTEQSWPALESLEMTAQGNPDRVQFHRSVKSAVKDAEFVQESVPEKFPLKHALYASIEPSLSADAIVASSASGATVCGR